ncbi:uncharacterized protein LOC144101987 [Amblyomma americanum]
MARPNEEQCWVCLLVTNEGCTETVSEKGNLSAFSLVPPRKKAGVHWSALFDFKSGTMLRSEAFVKKGVVCGCLSSVSRRQWSAWSTEAAAVTVYDGALCSGAIYNAFIETAADRTSHGSGAECNLWLLDLFVKMGIPVLDEAWKLAQQTKDGADVTVVDKHVRDVINTLRICYKKKWQS